MHTHDLIIIGGGRAATLAVAAGKAGKRVALIERDRLGGTCPNRGCVPSKLLIGYGEAARRVREAKNHFIEAEIQKIDRERIFREVNEWIEPVDERYEGRLPESVELLRGTGSFLENQVVEVTLAGGASRIVSAPEIVVATGTRPRPVPVAFRDLPVWTSDSLFPLEGKVPERLLIVGGGYIACELASFFSGIGVATTMAVRGDRLLGREDGDIREAFTKEFSKEVRVLFGTSLAELSHDGAKFHAQGGALESEEFDAVLFAIGRTPNADEIGLENTDIVLNGQGFIQTDDHLRTSVEGVYAAGDIAGKWVFQHAASFDMHYLRQALLKGDDAALDYGPMPHAVFGHPEVAGVGATEEDLKESGDPYVSVLDDWLVSARAMSWRVEYPRVKLLVDPRDYRLLGCHLVGLEASTLLHEVLPFMRHLNDVRKIPEMIHVHPALGEVILSVAVQAVSKVREWQAEE
jgi:mycothione reductase